MENNENNLELEECGQCDCFHKPGYTGDCRDDYNRYADWQDTLSIGEKKDKAMEVVSLTVVCKKGDGECIAKEMINSASAQLGIYSYGTNVRPATEDEKREVIEQTPDEILNEHFGD